MNESKSGCSPRMRWISMSLRSRSISFMRSMSPSDISSTIFETSLKNDSVMACLSCSSNSWNLCSRLRVEELVALQRLDLPRWLLGHLVQELLLALDDAAQHVGEGLLFGGAALAAPGLRGRAAGHLAALAALLLR